MSMGDSSETITIDSQKLVYLDSKFSRCERSVTSWHLDSLPRLGKILGSAAFAAFDFLQIDVSLARQGSLQVTLLCRGVHLWVYDGFTWKWPTYIGLFMLLSWKGPTYRTQIESYQTQL